MEKISPQTEEKIIQLRIAGMSRDEIAKKLRISGGAVSGRIEKWEKDLKDPEYAAVKKFTRACWKLGLKPAQVAQTARLFNVIKKMNAKEAEIEPLIVELYNACTKTRKGKKGTTLFPRQVADYAIQLFEIAKAEKIHPSLVPEHFRKTVEELKTQVEEYQRKAKEAREAKEKARQELDEELKSKKITMQKIMELDPINQGFTRYNLSPEKGVRLLQKVDELANSGHDIRAVANKIKEIQDLEKEEKSLRESLSRYQKLLERRRAIYEVCEEFVSAGLGAQQVRRIGQVIGRIERSIGLPRRIAIEKFLRDMEDYDKITGFKGEQIRVSREVAEYVNKYKWLDDFCALKDQIIPFLIKVHARGVLEGHLLRLLHIIDSEYKRDFDQFEQDLEKGRSARRSVQEMETEWNRLSQPSASVGTTRESSHADMKTPKERAPSDSKKKSQRERQQGE